MAVVALCAVLLAGALETEQCRTTAHAPTMMQLNEEALRAGAEKWQNPAGVSFVYGTSGFRTVGDTLPGVAFRMGILMACRAAYKGGPTGIVVSASHNPHQDNGMKLVDVGGAMLEAAWEPLAEKLGNARTADDISTVFAAIASAHKPVPGAGATLPKVFLGRDTRPTGTTLSDAVKAGVAVAGGVCVDFGVVSTPQLHFFVHKASLNADLGGTDDPTEELYYSSAVEAFKKLTPDALRKVKVVVDASNGVGYQKMVAMAERMTAYGIAVEADVRNGNTAEAAALNHLCGADFVQKEKTAPAEFSPAEFGAEDHLASLDGDADRIVYFSFAGGRFNLIDGDRIAVLYATLVKSLTDRLIAEGSTLNPTFGIVQTAYANGASTSYMRRELKTDVVLTPTGVKHLHHKAVEYDVGVYFEANGHGTVVFSPAFLSGLRGAAGSPAAGLLLAVSDLASPVCGDAIADLLLCEVALQRLGWSVADWERLYADAPSRMTKVAVPDPARIKTVWNQTKTTEPAGLQEAIEAAVAQYPEGSRSFVRPSGTEPIVRVYAESDTQANADSLAKQVEDVVAQFLR
ncbi:Phosphoacetylglucosamine mutase [Diplonema papillatum]|nr:Phosphoacetylglucosamine mutase [Diplonema papillatum]